MILCKSLFFTKKSRNDSVKYHSWQIEHLLLLQHFPASVCTLYNKLIFFWIKYTRLRLTLKCGIKFTFDKTSNAKKDEMTTIYEWHWKMKLYVWKHPSYKQNKKKIITLYDVLYINLAVGQTRSNRSRIVQLKVCLLTLKLHGIKRKWD